LAVGVVWFSDADLRRLAGDRSYGRAAGYLDAVGALDELPDGGTAVVYGSEQYRVRLSGRDGRLVGECDCPHGRDGAFCKHCVAVGLVLLAPNAESEPVAPVRRRGRRGPVDVRAALESVDRAELVDLLVELAATHPDVHRRLSLRAATAGEPDLAELRRLVDTLRPRGFVDYSRSFDYARKATDVLDALDVVARRDPGGAGPLYRRVLQHVIRTSEQADDSAGTIGDVADRAVDAYAAACRAEPPDPVGLARWLIDTQLDGPGWPDIDVADFADALGPDGLAAYWRQLTDLAAATADADRFDHRAFVVTHLREGYLRAIAHDPDGLVALYAEDLTEPYQYVRIGQVLRDAGRTADAVGWLLRGRAEAARPDTRIDELLAEIHTDTGRYGDALDLRWQLFTRNPDVTTHRTLLDAAERAGALPDTAQRAMTHLEGRAGGRGHAADPLVNILLAGGDVGGAWAAATEHQASPGALLAVAQLRARTHPADAIPVYAAEVDTAIDRKDKTGYTEAARLLLTLKNLHDRAGTDFRAYLDALTHTHRRKTTLLAILTRAGL
jgi:uncharacterized Zn finger protein